MIKTQYDPYSENAVVMGMAQTGKTRLAKFFNKEFHDKNLNQIIYDPNGRWIRKGKDPKEPVFSPSLVVHSIQEIKPVGTTIVIPRDDTDDFFTSFCQKVWSFRDIGNFNITIDETHDNVTTYKATEAFKKIVRKCNNFNIGYLAICQRTQEVPKMMISNARHIWSFHLQWPADIDLMKKFLGKKVERLDADSEDPLPLHHGFYKTIGKPVEEFEA